MKVIFSHPTGNANARAAALGLREAGLLASFHTTLACFEGTALDKLGGLGCFSEIRRRRFHPSLRQVSHIWPYREASRLIATKLKLKQLLAHESGLFCIDSVYRGLDDRVAKSISNKKDAGINAVYGYEDGALASFKSAKGIGLKCFYDLPIGYWRSARKLMADESEKWPEWVTTLGGFKDSSEKLDRKDDELRLADRIFVASTFTAKTLSDFPGLLSPVTVIPYGFPDSAKASKPGVKISRSRPLKLLFVGGLSQRKGIANMFAAVNQLSGHVELTVVGLKPSSDCPALDKSLSLHRWIPSLPHSQIIQLMREHDVLLFPSLFEGFGLVITEAMSQGTPVITTTRTAGADLIKHGENGWLVEAGSTDSLRSAIESILLVPDKLDVVANASLETARLRSWSDYGRELAIAVQSQIICN